MIADSTPIDPTRTPPRRMNLGAAAWVLVPAAVLVIMLVQAHLQGDYDPTMQRRMADYPGDLARFLGRGAVELLVLALVVRPWSPRWSAWRMQLAFVLWTPWAMFSSITCMHCGSVGGSHAVWAMLMAAALFLGVVVTAIGSWRRRAVAS